MIKPLGASVVARIGIPSRGLPLVVSQLVRVRGLSRKLNSYNANSSLLTIEWE